MRSGGATDSGGRGRGSFAEVRLVLMVVTLQTGPIPYHPDPSHPPLVTDPAGPVGAAAGQARHAQSILLRPQRTASPRRRLRSRPCGWCGRGTLFAKNLVAWSCGVPRISRRVTPAATLVAGGDVFGDVVGERALSIFSFLQSSTWSSPASGQCRPCYLDDLCLGITTL